MKGEQTLVGRGWPYGRGSGGHVDAPFLLGFSQPETGIVVLSREGADRVGVIRTSLDLTLGQGWRD